VRKTQFLSFYTRHFQTAEINNTFYRLPSKQTLAAWRDQVPKNFVFSVKASRYITHMKKLKDPDEPVSVFLGVVSTLKERLGPILFQLPPRWRFNPVRLQNFLECLPRNHRYVFEFRDESWFQPECYEMLRRHQAAFCLYELAGTSSPKELTADFVYVRLHGPRGAYRGQYGVSALAGWAGAFSAWLQKDREVFCYFDNDETGYAPLNALRLKKMFNK
jgi:uncharacterized protein YecE (DUF72 family)